MKTKKIFVIVGIVLFAIVSSVYADLVIRRNITDSVSYIKKILFTTTGLPGSTETVIINGGSGSISLSGDLTSFNKVTGQQVCIGAVCKSAWDTFSETDPTVQSFAQTILPTCSAGEMLQGDGTTMSCVSETDLSVQSFAKTVLPTCGAGEMLKGDGSTLSCVAIGSDISISTNNSIGKWNGSNLVDSAIYDSGGNIGIGTATPSTLLHLDSTQAGDNQIIRLENTTNLSANIWISLYRENEEKGRITTAYSDMTIQAMNNNNLHLYDGSSNGITVKDGGNIGIGTNTPSSLLDIQSTSAWASIKVDGLAGSSLVLKKNNTDQWSIQANDNLYVWDNVNSQTRMVITTGGNIGIGTTSPKGKLHAMTNSAGTVIADTDGDEIIAENSANGGISILTPDIKFGKLIFGSPSDSFGAGLQWNYSGSKFIVGTAKAGASLALSVDNDVEAVRIDSNGNVGIGTTTPQSPLHINGANNSNFELKITDTDNVGIELRSSGTNKNSYIDFVDTSTSDSGYGTPDFQGRILYNGNFDVMQFYTNASSEPSITLQSNGFVGIGAASPGEKLTVLGGNIVLREMDNGFNAVKLWVDNTKGAISAYNGGVESIRLDGGNGNNWIKNGNLGIGTTTPQGALDVSGSIYQRGGSLHADYVFEPEYKLESIEEHSKYMWQNKHLKAVPKAFKDSEGQDIVEWGNRNKGVLEELEKAHVYIDQLNTQIKDIKTQNTLLKQEIQQIKNMLETK